MAGQIFPWIVTAATVLFLSFCAGYNRRTGYRKARHAESALEDVLQWLNAVRDLIPSSGSAGKAEKSLPQIVSPQKQSEQLLSLNKALLEQSSSKAPEKESEPVAGQR